MTDRFAEPPGGEFLGGAGDDSADASCEGVDGRADAEQDAAVDVIVPAPGVEIVVAGQQAAGPDARPPGLQVLPDGPRVVTGVDVDRIQQGRDGSLGSRIADLDEPGAGILAGENFAQPTGRDHVPGDAAVPEQEIRRRIPRVDQEPLPALP